MGAFFCKQEPAKEPRLPPYDFYRCSYLRYMGFASVIASTMIPQPFAHIPQMAATAYIFSDVFSKTLASVENDDEKQKIVITSVDAILWQAMASVIAPMLLYAGLRSATNLVFPKRIPPIGPVTKTASKCKKPPTKIPQKSTIASDSLFVKMLPGAIALMMMPYIVKPIQCNVDYLMDQTYRKWFDPDCFDRGALADKTCEDLAKERRARADQREKELMERCLRAEKAELERKRIAAEKAAQKAREEALEREKRRLAEIEAEKARLIKEAQAKEEARLKCLEEEKQRKEELAAAELKIKEKLKQEETEFLEKKAKLEQDLKDKTARDSMKCD